MKDNKNHHLQTFLSLLITYKGFEEVELRVLVVGDTHEDIDKRYLSKKLRE